MWWSSLWPPMDPEWLPWPVVDRVALFCGVYFVVVLLGYWSSELTLYVLWVTQGRGQRSKDYGRFQFMFMYVLSVHQNIIL